MLCARKILAQKVLLVPTLALTLTIFCACEDKKIEGDILGESSDAVLGQLWLSDHLLGLSGQVFYDMVAIKNHLYYIGENDGVLYDLAKDGTKIAITSSSSCIVGATESAIYYMWGDGFYHLVPGQNPYKYKNQVLNVLNLQQEGSNTYCYATDKNGTGGVYSIVNGGNLSLLAKENMEFWRISGNNLYYADEDNQYITCLNLSGQQKTQLSTKCISNIFAREGKIYFLGDDGTGTTQCCVMGVNNTVLVLAEGNISWLDMEDKWIYYNIEGDIYRMKSEGANISLVIADTNSNFFEVSNGWIYVQEDSISKRIRRVKADGSSKEWQRVNFDTIDVDSGTIYQEPKN